MSDTGITRTVDELGRIVLPSELRNNLNITEKTQMQILVDGESIILKKKTPSCVFCSSDNEIHSFKNKDVCGVCRKELAV